MRTTVRDNELRIAEGDCQKLTQLKRPAGLWTQMDQSILWQELMDGI